MLLRNTRWWISLLADLSGLLVIVVPLGIAAYKFRHHDVPAWLFIIVACLALVLLFVCISIFLTKRERDRGPEAALSRQIDSLQASIEVASGYLSRIDDFLWGIRDASVVGRTNPGAAREQLRKLRPLVFNAVVQGINSAQAEQVRCVYFTPCTVDDEDMLCPKHHHGHSHRVEKLRLHADHRSLAGRAYKTGQAQYAEDAKSDPRLEQVPEGRQIGSLLCLPAFGYSDSVTPVGIFSVASNRVRAFSRADREFASVCASLLVLIDAFEAVFAGRMGDQQGKGLPQSKDGV